LAPHTTQLRRSTSVSRAQKAVPMTIRFSAAVLLLLAATAWGAPLGAQESLCPETDGSESARPCVALVLAGGGAKGGAHVGVLKVLEELQVPVDMVLGTSMGSIVGGVYAAGFSPAEVEEIMGAVDWDEMFSSGPPRIDNSIRRKVESRFLTIGASVGMDGLSPNLPPGLVSDQNINFFMQNLTAPVAGVSDFDDLPIPFRAVAADLVTGEAVVLKDGSLADAMRASLSLPGVFPPVHMNGRLLVDGGIAMNFPVELAQRLGADVIIAVEVPTPPATQEDLTNALSVTGQLVALLTVRPQSRSRAALRETDIHMSPDLHGVGTASFDRIIEVMDYGEEEARRHTEALSRLSVDDETWARWMAGRGHSEVATPTVDFIRVTGSDLLNSEVIEARISLTIGSPLDLETLRTDLRRIHGLGWYERVGYRIVEEGGRTGVEVVLEERSWGPQYLRSGLAMSDDLSGGTSYRLLLSYLAAPLNGRGGELRLNASFGDPLAFSADLYQPLDNRGRFFVGAVGSLTRYSRDPASNSAGEIVLERGNSRSIEAGAGFNIGNSAEVRAMGQVRRVEEKLQPDDSGPSERVTNELALATRILVDRLDNPFFPMAGTEFQALWTAATDRGLGTSAFHHGIFSGSAGGSIGERFALRAGGEVGTSFGTEIPAYRAFRLGGIGRISGLGSSPIIGNYLGLGFVRGDYVLVSNPAVELLRSVRLGGSVETGNVWDTSAAVSADDLLWGGSLYVGVDTKLGPFVFGFGLATGGSTAWYLSLGNPL